MPTCLDNIVGVTDKVDIPFYADLDPSLQDDIALSSSGLYMDSLTGGLDLYAVEEVENMNSVLKLAIDARVQAAKVLSEQLLLAINNRFQPGKTKFIGDIGRRIVSATSSSSGNNQGHRYRMKEPIAGYISISSIWINVNGSATFDVYVARCSAKETAIEEILYTFPVTSVANTWTSADMSSQSTGIKLPMEIDGIEQEYYIFWKRDESGGLFPKNNDMKCNTCGFKKTNAALDGFMYYDGVSLADTGNLKSVSADKMGHGISVKAVVGCDHSLVICREYEKKEAVQLMMQWAALYKAGALWIEYILKSGYVSKVNMQSREYFWGKRNNFEKEFSERVTAIANVMELGETHCYVCKDDTMFKGTIFS